MSEFRTFVIRTAATEWDLQGRITGRLDVPLSALGIQQAARTAEQLQWESIEVMYRAPCQAAQETAALLYRAFPAKIKVEPALANVDFGLWHGKRIEDLKKTMPKAFRCLSEHPEYLFPPEGESVKNAVARIRTLLQRIAKKHSGKNSIAFVVPPPIAAIAESVVAGRDIDCRWCQLPADGGWSVHNQFLTAERSIQTETIRTGLF